MSVARICRIILSIRKQYEVTFTFTWNFYPIMTGWISSPWFRCSDKRAPLIMVPLHEKSDNRSQPGQKLSKKEKWLRNLIKSSLVDSDAWWRAHYEAWSFSNDTTVSRTRWKNLIRVTSIEWYCKPVNNMKIRRGSCKKKEINLGGVHLAQIAKLWICFQIMSLPACQLTCHFL